MRLPEVALSDIDRVLLQTLDNKGCCLCLKDPDLGKCMSRRSRKPACSLDNAFSLDAESRCPGCKRQGQLPSPHCSMALKIIIKIGMVSVVDMLYVLIPVALVTEPKATVPSHILGCSLLYKQSLINRGNSSGYFKDC